MPVAQIVRWGNSLAVRIPKPLAKEAGLTEGDGVVLEASEGQIGLRRHDRVPTLKELVARITPENRYGETVTAREFGQEVVEW